MSVRIRLARQGGTHNPIFAVVVMPRRSKRDGKFLAKLGQYLPKEKDPKNKLKINLENYQAWIAKGAIPTNTVGQLVKSIAK